MDRPGHRLGGTGPRRARLDSHLEGFGTLFLTVHDDRQGGMSSGWIHCLPPPPPSPQQSVRLPRPAASAGDDCLRKWEVLGRKGYFITPAIHLVLHTISSGFCRKLGVPRVERVLSAATHTRTEWEVSRAVQGRGAYLPAETAIGR